MTEEVEQITKEPEVGVSTKVKDPKKVKAGKKLAEYNKKAKEALKREEKREAKELTDEGWSLPHLSFPVVLSLIGIGITMADVYMRYRSNKPTPQSWEVPVTVTALSNPKPRIGME